MSVADLMGPYGRYLRQTFYLVIPWETMYSSVNEVPSFTDQAIPYWLILMAFDIFFCKKKAKHAYQAADSFISLAAGFIQNLVNKLILRGVELYLYIWVYERFCIWHLPTDSAWTWILAFISVDFFYYWMHRGTHEINFFWSFHQMHHSSEFFNLTTALRQAIFQQQAAILFYLPMALYLPPSMYLCHEVLNRLYQFWIHTPIVDSLGPFELIFNTPSHHRVHHGRNAYCIDKNYAGVLIIWDRLFGTFEAERLSEPVVYGLVHPVATYDMLHLNFGHLKYVLFDKFPSMQSWKDKIKAIWYGPGWFPGTPRLGDPADLPEVHFPVKQYHSGVPVWITIYVFLQGAHFLIAYMAFIEKYKILPWIIGLFFSGIMIISIHIFSWLLEQRPWSPYFEITRCLFCICWLYPIPWSQDHLSLSISLVFVGISAILWILMVITNHSKFGKKSIKQE